MEKIVYLDNLNKIGIYELRELARRVGVVSPTTKKRNELIEQITKSIENGATPQDSGHINSRKGRPPNIVSSVDNFFDNLIPNELKIKEENEPNVLILKNFEDSNQVEMVSVHGYLRKTESGYYYMYNMNNMVAYKLVYIPTKIVEDNQLIEGDFIEAVANGEKYKLYCMLNYIIKLNFGMKNLHLNSDKITISSNLIPELGIKTGERVLKQSKKNLFDYVAEIKDILEKLKLQDYYIVFCATNVSAQQVITIERTLTCKLFLSYSEDTFEITYNTITNAINHAKAISRTGKNVIFCAFDILDILNCLDLYYGMKGKMVVFNHCVEAVQTVKKMFSLGRQILGGASITTIMVCTDVENSFIQNNLYKISTNIVK